jgi:hypothetical protein
MELMQYDAATLSDDEFNFGVDFLKERIAKSRIRLVSCNLHFKGILPYVIKESAGVKIAIVGLTNPAAKGKAEEAEFSDYSVALGKLIRELKPAKADLIVLLCNLGEAGAAKLARDFQGIDVIIEGFNQAKKEPFEKVGGCLLLYANKEGRRLGLATLEIKDKKIVGSKVEGLRLCDKIADDPEVSAALPKCFSAQQCRKEGQRGSCLEPGTEKSRCAFTKAKKIELFVITKKDCIGCQPQAMVNALKKSFPGLSATYLYYPQKKAAELAKKLGIDSLPAFAFERSIEAEDGFDTVIKPNARPSYEYYVLKPEFSGLSFYIERKKVKGRLDLFLSLFDKDAYAVIEAVRGEGVDLHFLARFNNNKFEAASGRPEVEEYERCVCINKYFPEKYWDYLLCRAKNINSSWWEDCLGSGADLEKIRACARGEEGIALLKENTRFNAELRLMFGPVFLLDNQEIFGISGKAEKEGLRKILKGKR